MRLTVKVRHAQRCGLMYNCQACVRDMVKVRHAQRCGLMYNCQAPV